MSNATNAARYVPCNESDVPPTARFDVPARNQGQIVEVSYAAWPRSRYEAGEGDAFRRTFDRSDRTREYARLAR